MLYIYKNKALDRSVATAKISCILTNEPISVRLENNLMYYDANFDEIFLNAESIPCGKRRIFH